jgi:hypothetical protein
MRDELSDDGVAASQDSIERVGLRVLEKFHSEGTNLTKSFLLECFLDSLREWLGHPDVEAVFGMPSEIAVWFFDGRRNEFRTRSAPCVDRAFKTWEAAACANGGIAN